MAYSDVLSDFTTILNRDDCSPSQAATFLQQAQRRIQREVKLPSMERQRLIVAQGPLEYFTVPPDLLQIIDVYADSLFGQARALERMSFRELCTIPKVFGPQAYARLENTIQVRGVVPQGGGVELLYYGAVGSLVNPTDDNEITSSCPDLLVYGALSFAGDNFEHPSAIAWEQRYQAILTQVQNDATALDSTGGPAVMQPFYNWSA